MHVQESTVIRVELTVDEAAEIAAILSHVKGSYAAHGLWDKLTDHVDAYMATTVTFDDECINFEDFIK